MFPVAALFRGNVVGLFHMVHHVSAQFLVVLIKLGCHEQKKRVQWVNCASIVVV